MKLIFKFLVILSLLISSTGWAKNNSKDNSISSLTKPLREKSNLPDALDFDRRESYLYRFEVSPYVGDFFGDKLQHSFTTGANLQVNLTEVLGVTTDFAYNMVSVDPTSALGKTFTTKNEFIVDGGFVLTQAAAFASKNKVIEADLFTSIGAGVMRLNGVNRFEGFLGGGMKIRPKIKWLAIRIEIRNYFTSVENPAGSNFEDDLAVHAGLTFLLPPEM